MFGDIELNIDNGVVIKYEGEEENVIIPYGVTAIGNDAFSGCYKLNSITIPSSVTSIGDKAFFNCTSLSSITIPDSVKTIGAKAFSYCTRLSSIIISDNVEVIEDETFFYCINLSSVVIGNKVTYIGQKAFCGCNKLSNITIPESVTFIDYKAFYNCKKLSNTISSTIKELSTIKEEKIWDFKENEDHTLSITNYKGIDEDIVIPEAIGKIIKITSIEEFAFSPTLGEYISKKQSKKQREIRKNIKSITIPSSITTIKEGAFYECSKLSSINIPESVTEIGANAFAGCYNLSSITIPSDITTIEICTFYDCKSLTSITIPFGVTTIRDSAFFNCTSLSSIIIPNSVKTIGAKAFSYCTNLSSITISESVSEIGCETFRCCTSLASITIPKSVRTIKEDAFMGCTGLKEITFEDKELKIQKKWFNSNLKIMKALVGSFYPRQLSTSLKAELIEEIVKKLNKYNSSLDSEWSTLWLKYLKSRRKFLYEQIIESEKLLNLMIKEKFLDLEDIKSLISISSEKSLIEISSILVDYQNKNFSAEEVLNATIKELNVNTTSVSYLKKIWSFKKKEDNTLAITSYKGTILDVVVPDVIGKNKVTSIEEDAFSPITLKRIGEAQREIRRNIKSITIPGNITSIHKDAFAGCESLTKVIILKSRTSNLVINTDN